MQPPKCKMYFHSMNWTIKLLLLVIIHYQDTYPPNDVHDHVLADVTDRDEIAASDQAGPASRCPRPVSSVRCVVKPPGLVAARVDVSPVLRTDCGTNGLDCMTVIHDVEVVHNCQHVRKRMNMFFWDSFYPPQIAGLH